jgi:diacylglycerol kinase
MSKFSIRQRITSFKYAFAGLMLVFKEEHNARIHLVAALLAVIAGFLLKISLVEWCIVIILITLVISLEIVNSSIENLANVVSPDYHPTIKKVKDLAAAAVLCAAIAAVIVAMLIFIHKIIALC